MATSTVFADAALAAVQPIVGWVSLHSADPGDGGANEIAVPPYARQVVNWSVATGGLMYNATAIEIPIPGGVPVYYVGLWSQFEGGDFLDSAILQTGNPPQVGIVLLQAGTVQFAVQSLSMVFASVGSS